jgi:integrase
VIDQFSSYQEGRGFSEHTIRRRRLTVANFARHLEPATLGDATLVDVEEWLNSHSGLRTRHAYQSDLRVFYRWAVKRHLLDRNPLDESETIRLPKSQPRPIGPEVTAALVTGSLRVRRMVALGLYAGLRCAEIANLDGADIDLVHRTLHVRQGKGRKDRTMRLHPALAELFAKVGPGPVFTFDGHRIQPESVSRTIRRHLKRLGIDATAHQLRHTFGTAAARAAKGDVVKVKTAMGHATAQTTFGYIGLTGDETAFIDELDFTARPGSSGDSAA